MAPCLAGIDMEFGSICSGIEAASVAWSPLGWKAAWLAEIDKFASAVLAHHYPHVPNLGDMTTIARRVLTGEVSAPDVLCGGTPCQAFSVAGLRESLADARGNLTLKFVELADAIDHVRVRAGKPAAIVFWENVPGVLSTKDNAFGCFLAGLAGEDEPLQPPGGKWANAGAVYGPARAAAWRTLDAQYFGVAQRRRRVFVVASARNDIDPAQILFEWDGMRRDTAPRRQAGQVAPTIPSRSTAGGGLGTDFDLDGGVIRAFGGNNQSGPIDVATARNACASASGRMDFETETFLVQTTHTLRGEGFDASEDGTGRGTPIVPVMPFRYGEHQQDTLHHESGIMSSLPAGSNNTVGHYTATVCSTPVAFAQNSRDEVRLMNGDGKLAVAIQDVRGTDKAQNGRGRNDDGTAYTLDTHATQGAAYAVALRGREGGATAELGDEVQNCLRASSGGGDKPHVLCETLYNKGFNHGGLYASTQETHTGKILRTLREAVGEEAFAQWGLGILGSLQSPEILRQALHGLSIRPAAFSRSWVVHCALSRSENGSGWLLQSLREAGCERCASQGWEPSEQLAGKLGAYLSELSQPGAQASRFVRDLWWAAQGPGLLREALSAVQEVGRPTHGQSQPAHGGMQVRRLTVEECEFLQGFPRGYTAIPWRGKPADLCPDGPRYKALGNSWAVPNAAWIGRRIAAAVQRAA